MATMGMGVAGSYVGYLLQRAFLGEDQRRARLATAHARAGARMRRELQALRGPAMKLGQTLSLQTGVVPDEALMELAALQREAPAMHPSLMRTQFRTSLGRDPESVYATFEEQPFAAASLGQVHRATLADGTRVAVKIQYPGIGDAIASDFTWFRAVSKPAQATGHLPGAAIDELEAQIVAETDYLREADNIDLFRRGMTLPFINVPKVFRRLASQKVLTMSLLPGEHLDDFLARQPPRSLRDLVGERLVELFYFQLLRLHALHADPHWGNYLFEADGTIGLVDFGCVKHLRPAFVADLQSFLLYPGSRRSPQFQAMLARRYKLMGGRINPAAVRTLTDFAEQFYGRVFPPDLDREHDRFDFGDRRFLQDYLQASRALVKSRGILPEYLFLARAEMGLYQTLHRLRARVATSRIVRRHLNGAPPQTDASFIGTSR
jgi:predicted unusual protein kinase regulating ubiquinone biosynthesis (AarF/ABC1/UbiB family)